MILRPSGDRGFTLVETLVSIALISVVMAGLTAFYAQSTRTSWVESQVQSATQIATSALEQAVQFPGDQLLKGRPVCAVTKQWQDAPSVVKTRFLTSMGQLSDSTLASLVCPVGDALDKLMGNVEPLLYPRLNVTMRLDHGPPAPNAPRFLENVYIGQCFQASGINSLPGSMSANDASCLPSLVGGTAMLRVVVAVTWPSSQCPTAGCIYLTSTLVPRVTADLTFN